MKDLPDDKRHAELPGISISGGNHQPSRLALPSILRQLYNKAEVSHEPTRQRERQVRRFKSPGQAQRFLTVHGLVQNLFRVGRHLLRTPNHRELRGCAFLAWDAVAIAT